MKALRMIALLVSVVLVAVVAWAVVRRAVAGDGGTAASGCAGSQTTVSGIIGSEKTPYLSDRRVTARLTCLGLTLDVSPKGSREMVQTLAAEQRHAYDFAFPSSRPAADRIKELRNVTDDYTPFSSVMAVGTWDPTVEVLRRAGVVTDDVLDIGALIRLPADTRWNTLDPSTANTRQVLLRTTDATDSNSAVMFVSIVSHVLNGDRPVSSTADVDRVMPALCPLLSGQGYKGATSQKLFEEYVNDGRARTPIALIYEQQFLDTVSGVRVPEGGGHRLLFPSPTVYSEHTVVPLTEKGARLGEALMTDDRLRAIATEYGFRVGGSPPPAGAGEPPNVIEPPEYAFLEDMLGRIETGRCGA